MAGDWIKMRGNLWDDPRVSKLCDLTDCGESQIVGGLYWLWATADQHTEDGVMPGLTLRQIDRKTGIVGFGAALCDIGWLADHPEGVRIIKFEEHNGESAKRRSSDAQRKANVRKVSDKLRTDDGQNADELRRIAELEKEKEKEKRRGEGKEEKQKPAPDGELFANIAPQIVADFKAMRKKQRAEITKTAIDGIEREAEKAGLSLEDALRMCCERGWRGFKAEWVTPQSRGSPGGSQLGKAGQATAIAAQKFLEGG